MASFTFQVDRAHRATQPLKFFPHAELTGDPFEVAAGQDVVYRGIVELGGKARFAFDVAGRKGYCGDRTQLESSLEERFDELVQI